LPNLTFVRYARPPREKLAKPENKSNIILGKTKSDKVFPKPGVSDKAAPIHVKWERPIWIETVNPAVSGDVGGLEQFGEIDLTQPPVTMEGSPELAAAPPEVRRVLSLEFARRRDQMDAVTQSLLKEIQRHPQDFTSPEVQIAIKTIKIRNLQKYLIDLYPYKNQPIKHVLTHMITSRRKKLGRLRELDYRRYEWLLEKLNLIYKPQPHDLPDGQLGEKENIARKASIEKLTDLWCSELRRHRLKGYERQLMAAQPEFLRHKAERLRHILSEERELGLEQTVTEQEILECERRAGQIEEEMQRGAGEEEEYLVYREEVEEENLVFKTE